MPIQTSFSDLHFIWICDRPLHHSCHDYSTRGKVLSKQNSCIWMGYLIAIIFSLLEKKRTQIIEFLLERYHVLITSPSTKVELHLESMLFEASPSNRVTASAKKNLCGFVCFRVYPSFYSYLFWLINLWDIYIEYSNATWSWCWYTWFFIKGPPSLEPRPSRGWFPGPRPFYQKNSSETTLMKCSSKSMIVMVLEA